MAARLVVWIAIAALAGVLTGCAASRSTQQIVSGWFGGSDAGGQEKPTALYAAAADVPMHESADASSTVVGKLALHEGVLRTRLENGFAHVRSEKSGRSGWVLEGQLVARLPATRKAAVEAPPAAPEPTPEPEPLETPDDPPAEAPERSIFDPY